MLVCIACMACGSPSADIRSPGVDVEMRKTQALEPLDGLRVVCYNVENLFDTIDDPRTNDADFLPHGLLSWTADRYDLKLDHLAEAIAWAGRGAPPLVGLVEVENELVLADLAGTGVLAGVGYQVIHHASPDERGIDVALLVDPDHALVAAHEALPVSLAGGDRTRDVLYVQLVLVGEERLHVFVNHWPSRRDGPQMSEPKRMAAAAVVRSKLDEIRSADPEALVLVMGDFNDGPTDRSIAEGLGAACNIGTDAPLYALMCMDQPRGHGSYNYQGEWSYLDQFMVSRSLLARVEKATAHWDDRLLFRHPRYGRSPDKTYNGTDHKGGYSDHLPIVLQLK